MYLFSILFLILVITYIPEIKTLFWFLNSQLFKSSKREVFNNNLRNLFNGNTKIINDNVNNCIDGINAIHPEAINSPYTFWSTIIQTSGGNDNYKQQIAMAWSGFTNNVMSYRCKDGALWTQWKQIITNHDLANTALTPINGWSLYLYQELSYSKIGNRRIINGAIIAKVDISANTIAADLEENIITSRFLVQNLNGTSYPAHTNGRSLIIESAISKGTVIFLNAMSGV